MMYRLLVFSVAILLAFGSVASANVYSGSGGSIPDSPSPAATFTINVTDPGDVTSLKCVTLLGLTHTWVGDLTATLSHGGQDVQLFRRVGATGATAFGDSSNLGGDYTFCAAGADFAAAAAAGGTDFVIPSGTYMQTGASLQATPPLDPDDYSVFANQAVAGAWTLSIQDFAGGDTGSLQGWSFEANVLVVPEPTTLGLLGVAMAAMGMLRRRG